MGLRGIPRARHGQGGLGSGVYLVVAVGLLAAAFALRLAGIDEPSIEQRETQSGLLARSWSVDRSELTQAQQRYSLPLIPILALAIGALAGWVSTCWRGRRVLQGVFVAVVAAAVVVAAQRAYTTLTPPPPTDRIAAYREIGELTGHTTRSIIVDRQLGQPAMYWGWIATRASELDYLEQPPAWIRPDEADYLIVVDPEALESHGGLRAYVAGHPVVARTDDNSIFDLRS